MYDYDNSETLIFYIILIIMESTKTVLLTITLYMATELKCQ